MLSIPGNQAIDCDGITRRELLRIAQAPDRRYDEQYGRARNDARWS